MAKLELNPLMAALHGTIGDLVLVRDGNSIYVRHRPRVKPPRTGPQASNSGRFAEASRWARLLLADPAIRQAYQRACQGHLTAHNVAVRDYLHGPEIGAIGLEGYAGQPGGVIRVFASDDFKIVHLTVQIRSVTGETMEEGEAEWKIAEGCWAYASQTELPPETTVLIEATALDLPGNRANAKAYYYVPRETADPR